MANTPTPVVIHMLEVERRLQASMATHMVLHEAVALLIGHLHRAGVVDAERFAAELVATFATPEVVAAAGPGASGQAATLAARIRDAARPATGPSADTPGRR